DFRPVILREGHEGEHVSFGLIHECGELRHLRAQLTGDLAPLRPSPSGPSFCVNSPGATRTNSVEIAKDCDLRHRAIRRGAWREGLTKDATLQHPSWVERWLSAQPLPAS